MSAGLARFAASDAGQFYALACREYGVDPGAAFDDDVLAHNLRVALMMSRPSEPEAVVHDDGRHVVHNPGLLDG